MPGDLSTFVRGPWRVRVVNRKGEMRDQVFERHKAALAAFTGLWEVIRAHGGRVSLSERGFLLDWCEVKP